MNKMITTIAHFMIILALLAGSLGIGGCDSRYSKGCGGDPSVPFCAYVFFPNGAPRLNQAKELKCLWKSPGGPTDNLTVTINLPDGLQLVSGNLSENLGAIPQGGIKEHKVIIKPLKIGNYTIECEFINSWSRSGHSGSESLPTKIYLSVSEFSGEWGGVPPWTTKGSSSIPVTPPTSQETP